MPLEDCFTQIYRYVRSCAKKILPRVKITPACGVVIGQMRNLLDIMHSHP